MKNSCIYKKIRKILIFIIQKIDIFFVEFFYFIRKPFFKENKIKKKNILFLVSQLCNGGAERVVANLCDEFSKKYNVILVTYTDRTDYDYPCSVKRIIVDEKKARFFKYSYVIRRLKKIKKKYRITHSISFCSKANYYNVMSKVYDKTIVSIRSYLKYSEVDQHYYKLNKKVGKYSDLEVVVSNQLIKEQIDEYQSKKSKIKVINNFVDKEKIDEYLKNKSRINLSSNTVINVGRLSEQKGQKYLIRAFKYVVKDIPDAKLVILGKGELLEELKEEIKNLKLENNVELLGYKKNPYVYMKNAKCFVLSSFFEGMPNVLLEAMYCSLPIISTDCISGVREIIAPKTDINFKNKTVTEEEYGILTPILKNEKNIELLSKAIIEILKNKNIRFYYQKQSKKRIKKFSKNKILKDWFKIIE